MRLEDIKRDLPETPDFIHEMIQSEVEKQLRDTKVIRMQARKAHRWTGAKAAAIAAVCILATGTAVYAGTTLYHMFTEKNGTYRIATGMKADDGTEAITIPDEIHEIEISAGFIPEGMVWTDDRHLEYPEHSGTGGFSFSSVLFDENSLSAVMQDENVVDSEEGTFGEYEGVYLKYQDLAEDGSFNQRIYLLCPELYRIMIIYVGDDVAKEDALKVTEKLEITETDTMMDTAGLATWSEKVSSEGLAGEDEMTSVADDQLSIHQIGDTFTISSISEDSEGQYQLTEGIAVCVDSVQVEDDLQLIDEAKIPEQWSDIVDAKGKLTENTLSYIKSGDGTDSIDEVIKTENVKQKLIYATVTFRNDTQEELHQILYLGNLMLMKHEDGRYQIYDPHDQSGEDYDRVIWNGAARTGEMTYFSSADDRGSNYISSLKAGESIQVEMAWIVNENDLPYMYLAFNGDGTAYSFTDSTLETGVVAIAG